MTASVAGIYGHLYGISPTLIWILYDFMVFISTNNQQDIGSLTDHRGFPQPTTELLRFYGIYG